jgi:hypothetical protein
LSFFLGLRLVIDGCVAQSDAHRVDHGFQQSNQGRKLRLRQTVNQLGACARLLIAYCPQKRLQQTIGAFPVVAAANTPA